MAEPNVKELQDQIKVLEENNSKLQKDVAKYRNFNKKNSNKVRELVSNIKSLNQKVTQLEKNKEEDKFLIERLKNSDKCVTLIAGDDDSIDIEMHMRLIESLDDFPIEREQAKSIDELSSITQNAEEMRDIMKKRTLSRNEVTTTEDKKITEKESKLLKCANSVVSFLKKALFCLIGSVLILFVILLSGIGILVPLSQLLYDTISGANILSESGILVLVLPTTLLAAMIIGHFSIKVIEKVAKKLANKLLK